MPVDLSKHNRSKLIAYIVPASKQQSIQSRISNEINIYVTSEGGILQSVISSHEEGYDREEPYDKAHAQQTSGDCFISESPHSSRDSIELEPITTPTMNNVQQHEVYGRDVLNTDR